jgi:nitroreductase
MGDPRDSINAQAAASPADVVRPLLRVRQIREFTDEPVTAAQLDAIADAGRWSGSSRNSQPWRFIVVQDVSTLRRMGETSLPQTRSLQTAMAAIAISMPSDPEHEVGDAYDEGRAAERMLIAASLLGLGAGIAWVVRAAQPTIREILGVPRDRIVRTILAIGRPSTAGLRPKSPPGRARLPRESVVFGERWPAG